jgi:hypothetical protein
MGRLGRRATTAQLIDAVLAARHAKIEALMTYITSASDSASTQTAEQTAACESARAALHSAGIHPPLTLRSLRAAFRSRTGCSDPGQCGALRPAAL